MKHVTLLKDAKKAPRGVTWWGTKGKIARL